MQLMDCTDSGHCSVLLRVTSVKDNIQLPVEGRLPAAAFDALAGTGENGTGSNGVTGATWRSASAVLAGRVAVLIVTPMRDIMPVAVLLESAMLGEAIRPQ
jgi:hypothetical protein